MKRKRQLLHTSALSIGIIGITHAFSPQFVDRPLPEYLQVVIFGAVLIGLAAVMRHFFH